MSRVAPDLTDVWARVALEHTPQGRRALDHWERGQDGSLSPGSRRHHRRAAERIARGELPKSMGGRLGG